VSPNAVSYVIIPYSEYPFKGPSSLLPHYPYITILYPTYFILPSTSIISHFPMNW